MGCSSSTVYFKSKSITSGESSVHQAGVKVEGQSLLAVFMNISQSMNF